MKVTRKAIFETNSSSTHSFSINLSEEWHIGQLNFEYSQKNLIEEVVAYKNDNEDDDKITNLQEFEKEFNSDTNLQKLSVSLAGEVKIYPGQEVWTDSEVTGSADDKASLVWTYILSMKDFDKAEHFLQLLEKVIKETMKMDSGILMFPLIKDCYNSEGKQFEIPSWSSYGRGYLESDMSDIIQDLFLSITWTKAEKTITYLSDDIVKMNLKTFIFNPKIYLVSRTGHDG